MIPAEVLQEIRQAIRDSLDERMNPIEEALDQLWEQPPPEKAVDQRALLPFSERMMNATAITYPNLATAQRGLAVFTSKALDTKGFTEHNAFVKVHVTKDSLPVDTRGTPFLTAVLEGCAGSPWVELDTATVNSNGGAREYVFRVLAKKALALSTRFVLYLADNSYHETPAVRSVDITVQGMLVSGLTYF